MPDIYIAGELTRCANPEGQKRFYEGMARVCGECGFSSYLPHQHTDPNDIGAPPL